MYFAGFLVFAIAFYFAKDSCGMKFNGFSDAFMFSVTTMMTIGYQSFWSGPADESLFNGCFSMVFLVALQSVIGTVLDAVCIGVVYDRLSRATNRANTILFSDKAILRKEGDDLTMTFRVAELRKHQLTEVHVRCVCVRHVLNEAGQPAVFFKSSHMRIMEPDDELGGMLFLALPSEVKHLLSCGLEWRSGGPPRSPLLPPAPVLRRYRRETTVTRNIQPHDHHEGNVEVPVRPNPELSEAGQEATQPGALTSIKTPLLNSPSVNYTAMGTSPGGKESEESEVHDRTDLLHAPSSTWEMALPTYAELQRYWAETELEIIVIIEGIESTTSDTTQARHSYSLDDVVFGGYDFHNCIYRTPAGACEVDFTKFHDLVQLQEPSMDAISP